MPSSGSAADLVAAGNQAEAQGRIPQACDLYRQAIDADPSHAPAHLNLGAALEARGDLDGAVRAYQRLLEIDPQNPFAHYNLANVAVARGALQASEELLRKALAGKPDFPEACVLLAHVLDSGGRAEAAAAHLARAVELRPGYAGAWHNLGLALRKLERFDEAEDALRRAIALQPDYVASYEALGALLRSEGRIREALEVYAAAPRTAQLESAELFTLLFSESVPDAQILERHRALAARLEAVAPLTHARPADAQKRLRIGFVSPDLHTHPIALFLLPVLERRDRAAFEMRCYMTGPGGDAVTERLRGLADGWCEAAGMSDAELVRAVRADGIDILVDLAGHAGTLRLGVFAQQAAPVQAAWLGYLHTTGLRRMQYRLCDAHTDPPGASEGRHTEKLARLPHSQWCYRPFLDVSPLAAPPCASRGHVTFGSFNHPSKLSDGVRERWRELLAQLPDAELVVLGVPPGRATRALLDALPASRVRVVPRAGMEGYFRWYNEVDIALDTFPYGGGTTTCDALWMGVPVVCALGERSVSRSAASLLTTAGLADWIAPHPGAYVELAVRKARDIGELANLRATLRARMQASPLMDEAGFAANLQRALRRMWRDWCDNPAHAD